MDKHCKNDLHKPSDMSVTQGGLLLQQSDVILGDMPEQQGGLFKIYYSRFLLWVEWTQSKITKRVKYDECGSRAILICEHCQVWNVHIVHHALTGRYRRLASIIFTTKSWVMCCTPVSAWPQCHCDGFFKSTKNLLCGSSSMTWVCSLGTTR